MCASVVVCEKTDRAGFVQRKTFCDIELYGGLSFSVGEWAVVREIVQQSKSPKKNVLRCKL